LRHTSVALDVDHGELGILADWERPCQCTVFTCLEHHLQIRHEVPGQKESSRHANFADVLFDVGLGVEVRDVSKAATARFRDVQERREDEVLDTGFFGHVGDVLALSSFGLWVR
jgi:hypothetical protein